MVLLDLLYSIHIINIKLIGGIVNILSLMIHVINIGLIGRIVNILSLMIHVINIGLIGGIVNILLLMICYWNYSIARESSRGNHDRVPKRISTALWFAGPLPLFNTNFLHVAENRGENVEILLLPSSLFFPFLFFLSLKAFLSN